MRHIRESIYKCKYQFSTDHVTEPNHKNRGFSNLWYNCMLWKKIRPIIFYYLFENINMPKQSYEHCFIWYVWKTKILNLGLVFYFISKSIKNTISNQISIFYIMMKYVNSILQIVLHGIILILLLWSSRTLVAYHRHMLFLGRDLMGWRFCVKLSCYTWIPFLASRRIFSKRSKLIALLRYITLP